MTENEREIKRNYEELFNFGWDKKADIVRKYIELMYSKGRPTARAERKLAEIEGYFTRNPHRKTCN